MLIALITDLHANLEALQACLAHAAERRVSQFAFLGDLVGYGADPAAVTSLVMEHAARGAWVLQGNHDAADEEGLADLPRDAQRHATHRQHCNSQARSPSDPDEHGRKHNPGPFCAVPSVLLGCPSVPCRWPLLAPAHLVEAEVAVLQGFVQEPICPF